ncbi:helix-turn-helix domain-containing protein [Clostridium perfringens]|uniref:DNA-binding helix-turn-helix protein n=1 Tax=Clostridium perfringens TaxID=1502 RepID=A0A133MNE3_CLOPF|nr:helix-turn-helix transcriptional regulator [Clostridium perfringens]ELU5587469.1 helix-turn-helix transcriptional regulator [Clostridium perfringens]KXA05554.1 DNA-binding helix-turn-helix protein [Clostridium perfringens]
MSIAIILDYERLKRGFTQQQFADFLGVARGTLSHHLTGRSISPKYIKIYSEKLDIDLANIYLKEKENKQ